MLDPIHPQVDIFSFKSSHQSTTGEANRWRGKGLEANGIQWLLLSLIGALNEGIAHHGPWVKLCPLSVFLNKVWLEHSHARHLRTVYSCLCTVKAS